MNRIESLDKEFPVSFLDSSDEYTNRLTSLVTCPVCFNLPKTFYNCNDCGKLICTECFEKLEECPMRCESKLFTSNNKTIKLTINLLNGVCQNNGCGKVLSVNELIKHDEQCSFSTWKCNFRFCSFQGSEKDVIEHSKKSCLKSMRECKRCDFYYEYHKKESHKNCEFKCIKCDFKLKKEELEEHLKNDCKFVNIKCEVCESYFKREEILIHRKISNCYEKGYRLYKNNKKNVVLNIKK
jgi:hypothetical protein